MTLNSNPWLTEICSMVSIENPIRGSRHLGAAFFHTAKEPRREIESSGFACDKILGIESPVGLLTQLEDWVREKRRMYELVMKYARGVEEEEEEENLIGASFHLLGVGRRP